MIDQRNPKYDVIVVGSGPNGLSAAITLAKAGCSVKLYEASDAIGGGVRSAELTLPGFLHDRCSAVYPMVAASPFFRSLPVGSFDVKWIHPPLAYAHPLDGTRVVSVRGLSMEVSANLGADVETWRRLFAPYAECGLEFFNDMLGPLSLLPRHPLGMLRFGLSGMRSAKALVETNFQTLEAKALFAGLAAHSLLPLERRFSAATGLALGLAAHIVGWPIPAGGSGAISSALGKYFQALGGTIELNSRIQSLENLPSSSAVLLDISAKQFAEIGQNRLPQAYLQVLQRFRQGPALFKIDWALSQPVPWQAQECRGAGTVHLGGTYEEVAACESEVALGRCAEKPFVLLSQPSLHDSTRAPTGKHILWGYCHLPLASTVDMTERIEKQIERFAPGFRDCILAKAITTPADLQNYNPNYYGGDISGGAMDWPQIFRRPAYWFNPYRTPLPNVYLCSASTPPGPGVHGMCGYHAAKAVLRSFRTMKS